MQAGDAVVFHMNTIHRGVVSEVAEVRPMLTGKYSEVCDVNELDVEQRDETNEPYEDSEVCPIQHLQ